MPGGVDILTDRKSERNHCCNNRPGPSHCSCRHLHLVRQAKQAVQRQLQAIEVRGEDWGCADVNIPSRTDDQHLALWRRRLAHMKTLKIKE